MTPLLAIRTPLSLPENHIDQYLYASIRSRHSFGGARSASRVSRETLGTPGSVCI